MTKFRYDRIGEEIKKEISEILLHEIKDPGLGFVSVTRVEVSSDLQQAKVYYSVMGGEDAARETQAALNRCGGFIRRELAHHLSLRHTPELIFVSDHSIEHGIRIAQILNEEKERMAGHDENRKDENRE